MEPIAVEKVAFYPKENAETNRTSEYDLVYFPEQPTPIFRRGCNFYFSVRFNRPFDEATDVIRVKFSIGPKPSHSKDTLVILKLQPEKKELTEDAQTWDVCLSRNVQEPTDIILQVHVPSHVPVGIWKCTLQTNIKGIGARKHIAQCDEDIYIIFNPWCKNDAVYMPKEDELKEYVLNESGKIWCGTFKNPKGKRWIFGQFDDVVLPAAVFLLEKTGLSHNLRGSPIFVTRAISQAINSADNERGVLEGNWSGNYKDGTSPHAWAGSSAIMDQYLRTNGKPVKYGQCWVFSAVVVTICRALGIPCRSITNYVSAHDTNASLTIDTYFDVFGDKIENGPDGDCNDSCWNFHVWNDVWMTRPDLPLGYGGWQVIDATPQEVSDNAYRCGPASVEAIRRGEVCYLYDTPFVFAEVNADICHFQEDEESDWGFKRLSVNKYHVGRKIITKRVDHDDDKGDSDLWDVTSFYKNPEGTEAERLSVYNAIRGFPAAKVLYEIPSTTIDDVFFDLIDIDAVPMGETFDVIVNIHNKSKEERNISAVLSAFSIYYTGVTANIIKRTQGSFKVKGGQKETLRINVTPDEYLDKLVEHSLIKIHSIANVNETTQTWSEEDDFTLTKPTVDVKLDATARVGQECRAVFSFQNPLRIPLTECTYTVEGPGLSKPKMVRYRDVLPREVSEFQEVFIPRREGERKIVVSFNSKELQGIGGSGKVVVL